MIEFIYAFKKFKWLSCIRKKEFKCFIKSSSITKNYSIMRLNGNIYVHTSDLTASGTSIHIKVLELHTIKPEI